MNYLATGKVAEPIFSLYTFQLKYNLAKGSNEPVSDANNLWEKIQEIVNYLEIYELDNLPKLIAESEINNPSNQDRRLTTKDLIFEKKYNKLDLRVGIDPLIIDDTYAANLTFAYPLPEVKLSHLKGLNPNHSLIPQNINASLGQTLIFFAKPLGEFEDEESLQEFADACVTGLLAAEKVQELKINCQNKGKLLGSHIFEYNNDADSPQEQCHILIWLNTNPQITALEKVQKCYYPLIELLLCRSKIIYVRNQAIWCNQQAQEIYKELESKVNEFNFTPNENLNSCLDKFQEWLRSTPDKSFKYSHYLRDLLLHRNTIRTNIKNYKLHLEEIKKIYNDDSQFLFSFLKLAQKTYIQQITTDLAYLIPGEKLFEDMFETIRGIVQIEEVKRDKSLERTIQVVGVGVGTGAIVGGVVTQHIDKPFKPLNPKNPFHPMVSSLFWSVLATITAGLLTWVLTKRKVKS